MSAKEGVDISDLGKLRLLRNLWNRQKSADYFAYSASGAAPAFDEAEAMKVLHGYIDYFCGRAIKCDLSKDIVNPRLYNRDAGEGAFEAVVAAQRR